MNKDTKNWIVEELYTLASAARDIKSYELSEDIASVAVAYDASSGRLDRHSQFMTELFCELAVTDK